LSDTLSEKIRSADKECAAVAFKTTFERTVGIHRIRAETVVIEVVVIADVNAVPGFGFQPKRNCPLTLRDKVS
jgi:hypothetical protein